MTLCGVACHVQLRRLPQLAADTPMYMLLQLFEVGGSHMALLTKPRQGSSSTLPKVKSGVIWAGADTTSWDAGCSQPLGALLACIVAGMWVPSSG
jgi:hypothetical protein